MCYYTPTSYQTEGGYTMIKLVYHPLGIEDGAGKPGNLPDTEVLRRMQKPEFVSQACAEK